MTQVLIEVAEAPALLGWRLELEITGKCQLSCAHCYADSGPGVTAHPLTRCAPVPR